MKMANGTGSIVYSACIPTETVRIIVGHAGQDVTTKVYLRKDIPELVKQINRIEV